MVLHSTSAAVVGSVAAFVMWAHRTCRDVDHGRRVKLRMLANSTEGYDS